MDLAVGETDAGGEGAEHAGNLREKNFQSRNLMILIKGLRIFGNPFFT